MEELNPKKWKKFHVWVVVGYDFKSDFIFYWALGNNNGKLLFQV